jgi:predicted RNase H-like nuclease (RuvC/YqgF family)
MKTLQEIRDEFRKSPILETGLDEGAYIYEQFTKEIQKFMDPSNEAIMRDKRDKKMVETIRSLENTLRNRNSDIHRLSNELNTALEIVSNKERKILELGMKLDISNLPSIRTAGRMEPEPTEENLIKKLRETETKLNNFLDAVVANSNNLFEITQRLDRRIESFEDRIFRLEAFGRVHKQRLDAHERDLEILRRRA